jgi:hypothetical protein
MKIPLSRFDWSQFIQDIRGVASSKYIEFGLELISFDIVQITTNLL